MTNRDLYNVKLGINKCSELVNVADINFTMAMARIDSEITAELKIIDKGKKESSDKYKEYSKKKEEIDMKFAIQKEDGIFQMLNGNILVRNPKEYHNEIDKLNEEYKEELDKVKKITDEFNDFLDKECNTKISKLPKSCIPAIINVEQMKLLFSVIE